jgi:hypothetical protein
LRIADGKPVDFEQGESRFTTWTSTEGLVLAAQALVPAAKAAGSATIYMIGEAA